MKNNYIIGINFLHSDSSACIFKNGELLAAVEEERFTREKHTSLFPYKSIKFCLNVAKIDFSEVSRITINTNPLSSIKKKILFVIMNPRRLSLAYNSLKNIKKKISLKNLIKKVDNINLFKGPIEYIDHHESHIASSLYFSNFDETVNLSIDGFGDFVSCAWGKFKNGNNDIDKKIYFPHSLGIFYQSITQYLGFKNYGEEYKVMGLSSYGKPNFIKQISKLIYDTEDGFKLNLDYFIHHNEKIIFSNENGKINYKNLYSKKLYDLLGDERRVEEPIMQRHMDIAKSVQTVYENILFSLLNKLYQKYKIKNLTLSGGCAMNSVANGKIIENTPFQNIYVSPNPGDAGGSVGSACVSIVKSNKLVKKINNYAYLGSSYKNASISEIIQKKKLNKKYLVNYFDDEKILDVSSDLLIKTKIIGWFQGRMEWGPRALGNRSILADARNPRIKEIINKKIKRRESFRPFAPSILNEYREEWFNIDKEIPFMSEVYSIVEEKRKLIPGVTHIDGTGRLQTVTIESNKFYYSLISSFYKKTGVPLILNTSFNENEPIVNTPEEAINCFERTEMDALIIENWIISRKNINEN